MSTRRAAVFCTAAWLLAASAVGAAPPGKVATASADLARARSQLRAGAVDQALLAFARATAGTGATREMALAGVGACVLALPDPQLQAALASLEQNPPGPDVLAYTQGLGARARGREDEARALFTEAVKRNPDLAEGYMALLSGPVRPKAEERAGLLKQAVEAGEVSTLAHRLWQDEDPQGLKNEGIYRLYLARSRKEPTDPRWVYLAGRQAPKKDQLAEGKRAVKLDPTYYWGHHLEAFEEDAAHRFGVWSRIPAVAPESRAGLLALLKEGLDLERATAVGEAAKLLQRLVPNLSSEGELAYELGRHAYKRGETQRAAELFQIALQAGFYFNQGKYLFVVMDAFPQSAAAARNMGSIYSGNDNFEMAREYVDLARRLDPRDVVALELRARLAWADQEPAQNVAFFAERALTLSPDSWAARRYAVFAALELGRVDAAKQHARYLAGHWASHAYSVALDDVVGMLAGDAPPADAPVERLSASIATVINGGEYRLVPAWGRMLAAARRRPELFTAVEKALEPSKEPPARAALAAISVGKASGDERTSALAQALQPSGPARALTAGLIAGAGWAADAEFATAALSVTEDSARELNTLVWSLASWNAAPTLAMGLARRLEPLTEEANMLDTVAFALYRGGAAQDAVVVQRRALERGVKGVQPRLRLADFLVAAGQKKEGLQLYADIATDNPGWAEVAGFRSQTASRAKGVGP